MSSKLGTLSNLVYDVCWVRQEVAYWIFCVKKGRDDREREREN